MAAVALGLLSAVAVTDVLTVPAPKRSASPSRRSYCSRPPRSSSRRLDALLAGDWDGQMTQNVAPAWAGPQSMLGGYEIGGGWAAPGWGWS